MHTRTLFTVIDPHTVSPGHFWIHIDTTISGGSSMVGMVNIEDTTIDRDVFPSIADFLRDRKELKTPRLTVGDSFNHQHSTYTFLASLGFDSCIWGVLPTLTGLKGLGMTYLRSWSLTLSNMTFHSHTHPHYRAIPCNWSGPPTSESVNPHSRSTSGVGSMSSASVTLGRNAELMIFLPLYPITLDTQMKVEIDSFSGFRIYPSKGKLFVRGDSKIFRFSTSKTASLFHQRKNPRKIAWTQVYRRMHKKGITEEVAKKRSRRTVKHQRGIVGADLAAIAAKRKGWVCERLLEDFDWHTS
ncbi:hypothetical protein D9758_015820 [Tetrapyrgos nigripes]|uniref:Large ribosomal subunit protein eL24-related N-terminal domain-containing protein n=1 Tax=Tetrapyrgos nigripes TaxID=182062 RepID=A0A8H5CF05_9AGAR|nr:hypothetical protein D9758_015820 [Tetrapyrgos nigripes]